MLNRTSYSYAEKDKFSAMKVKFLAPIVAMIVLFILFITVTLFYFESENRNYEVIYERLTQSHKIAGDYYQKTLKTDVAAIRSIMSAMQRDDNLTKVFATYDRNRIFEYTQQLYKEFNQNYNITHFYFSGPDRLNILRVHAPLRYGDFISRTTTLRAEKNQEISYGVELGVLGTFTLRVVSPWKDTKTGKLIGYIELGMEIDHVIEGLKSIFGMEVAVVIFKKYLDKQRWTEGMSALNRHNDWDNFEPYILSSGSMNNIPHDLVQHLKKGKYDQNKQVQNLTTGKHSFWLLSLPLFDVNGRKTAEILMFADVSMEMNTARQTATVVGISVSILGFILILFFWWQSNSLGNRIMQDEKDLNELATIDGLTGLYNRRIFDELLHTELQRSVRFEHSLSLLILDVDYFKEINDKYGHPVGDKVLEILAKRISDESRQVDYVCRYGGEEFVIILPETGIDSAVKFASRLLKVISFLPFYVNSELEIPVTVSIGISGYPEHAKSGTLLLAAADKALYAAKKAGRNQVYSIKG